MPSLVMVAAIARNGVIGVDNKLPWGRLSRDMVRFSVLTKACGIVLMGRKTADSLPKPLEGRRNLVLSKSQVKGRPGFEHFDSLRAALKTVTRDARVAVIGGSEIYRMCAPFAERAYLTFVHEDFEGDATFPHDALREYEPIEPKTNHPADEDNAFPTTFVTAVNNNRKELP